MMKHAPGKWKVTKYDNGFSIYAGHFRCVAERFEVDPSDERLKTHIANATLMATAPVLLAALELWFECADEHEIVCRCGRDAAQAAIAKAKGESHARH